MLSLLTGGLKGPMTMVMIAVLASAAGAAGLYYWSTQKELRDLRQANTTLTVQLNSVQQAAEESQRAFDNSMASMAILQEKQGELQIRLKDATQYNTTLINKLRQHDLTYLSKSKPGLIERRVNDATQKIFSEFESITATD